MKKRKKSKISIALIVIDILAVICFFFAYGPVSYFRDLLVTTAMTTMNHRYFAYVLYSEDQVNEILENNRVIESRTPSAHRKDDIRWHLSLPEKCLKKPTTGAMRSAHLTSTIWRSFRASRRLRRNARPL